MDSFPSAPTPSAATTLNTFTGTNPNGTWKLYVVNNVEEEEGAGAGSIASGWCLSITTKPDDTTPPTVSVINPSANDAVQDIITLKADAADSSGIKSVSFFVREPGGTDGEGTPIGMENLTGTYKSGHWEYLNFDTTQLQDGNYVVLAKAVDKNNNEGWSSVVAFTIRNWAMTSLLPSTPNNKAGRTMPIKFTLRVASSVEPETPFVYNEDLEIRIYPSSNPSNILQTSHYGNGSKDYRIDNIAELYIANFATLKTPTTYVVEIWRPSNNFMVGRFMFITVK